MGWGWDERCTACRVEEEVGAGGCSGPAQGWQGREGGGLSPAAGGQALVLVKVNRLIPESAGAGGWCSGRPGAGRTR